VTGLAITGADAVLRGSSAGYTLTATFGDGGTGIVTPVWTSSNPGVASVDGAGRLEGLAHGSTGLTATYEGRSVSKTVQVVNNYGGTWEGRYVIKACRDTGDLTDHDGGWCRSGPGRVGTVGSITMTLVQGGERLSEVYWALDPSDAITGAVSADGRLNLEGTITLRDWDYDEIVTGTLHVGPWDTNLDGTGGMTGRWSEDLTLFSGRKGTAHTEQELVTMTRVSTITRPR